MSRKAAICAVAGVIVIVGAILTYLALGNSFNTVPTQANATDSSENQSSSVILESVKVYDERYQIIGDLKQNETFMVNQPIFISANFTSNGSISTWHSITSEIRGADTSDVISSVQGYIAPSKYLSSAVYWKPEQKGTYQYQIFIETQDTLHSTVITPPAASITLKVE